jgi:hypothetical protein
VSLDGSWLAAGEMKVPGGDPVENDAPIVTIIRDSMTIPDGIIMAKSSHFTNEGKCQL